MAEMRLDDWITIGVMALKLLAFGVSVMLLIVLWPHLVSIVSSQWRHSIERARAQKARRDRLYGYADITSTNTEPAMNQRFGSGFAVPVPGQQNQEFQNQFVDFEDVKTFLAEHNLSDEQVVITLALIRRANGDELLSANKIRDIAGGADGAIKPIVAAHRKPRPKSRPQARIARPPGGWPKSA
jgi:hypothetical protein